MNDSGSAVTIGVFDGVHRGHQALIAKMVTTAATLDLRPIVVTFDPNPLEVLRPEQAPTRLTSIERRVDLIAGLGVDYVAVLPFTAQLAAMTAEEFVRSVLQDQLDAREVVIGHGFRFGNKARGTAHTMREAGLQVEEYALVGDGDPLSSTRIRACVRDGDVRQATQMLGRPPEVEGIVVRGEQRGRALGYPTANVEHHELAAVPADGVYAGLTHVAGRDYAAAISVGTNPTFDGASRTVESHILDFDADIYGQHVRVEFVERLRSMEAFAGVEGLVAQMADDVRRTRESVPSDHRTQG